MALILSLLLLATGCAMAASGLDGVNEEALAVAMDQVGDPYVWAGQGPDEFDCSGLVIWSYMQVYPDLALRIGSETVYDVTMDDLWRYNVVPIPPEKMEPGDIVFITKSEHKMTHGGMFIEWVNENEFKFVNASSYEEYGEVVVDTWPVEGEKRGHWFAGAGRLQTVY